MADSIQTLVANVGWILGPNKAAIYQMIRMNADRFAISPGSKSKHQAWEGGWLDHINEMMHYATRMWTIVEGNDGRMLPFNMTDVMLVIFLHDLEKPFKYVFPVDQQAVSDPEGFKFRIMQEYGITLTEDQENALLYIHGEGNDYGDERVMGPLAAYCHMLDTLSARIWFDYPKKKKS